MSRYWMNFIPLRCAYILHDLSFTDLQVGLGVKWMMSFVVGLVKTQGMSQCKNLFISNEHENAIFFSETDNKRLKSAC